MNTTSPAEAIPVSHAGVDVRHGDHQDTRDVSRTSVAMDPILPLPYPLERRTVRRTSLCVVLPAFNEAEALPLTYAALRERLDSLDADWRILFVNDGSSDSSPAALHSLRRSDDRVGYLLLARNFGHQAALTAGLDHAEGDVVITMDADLQHPPSIIPDMIALWRDGYDVVHTRKLVTQGLSPLREIITRIAYRIIQRVSRVMIIPHASDFRLIDRSVIEAMRGLPETNRLYRGLTPWLGFRQCVLSIVATPRAAGRSQYGMRQLLSLFAKAFFDFSSAPLHLGLLLGGAAVGLSVLYFTFILGWILFGADTPPGWASSVSVTLLLNSISLAFSGIIGVYVARIYDQVRARPPYVVSHAFSPRPIDAP